MPITLVVAIILVAVSVPLVAWLLTPGDRRARRDIRQNLAQGLGGPDQPGASESPTGWRIAGWFVVPANRSKLDQLLALAGRPAGWPMPKILKAKPLLALVAGFLGAALFSAAPTGWMLALVLSVITIAYFVPDLLLYSRGIERQARIGLELADTLDQMLIAVEAGLGFEAAMSRAGQNGKGPLAEELVRTLQDMRVGMSRKEAYQSLARRTSVPDLRAFIRAVVQADSYGISISAVLRTQAKEMRIKRRQRAEEKAMQIPVKVLFPLMLFILPVLFIAVLGPTVITVVGSM
ncbi:type II secretion system F family protein [Glaciibacter superstes]|uniref:type II secretion system F family protein n=1 Tax=Glaciibacter superstes TaxID=501023 RepID=UPI0003B4574A|nr:type II secretion system F family protein [Glaciibacter superstes]